MNINFNDGSQRITINGDKNRVIRWNPSDIDFVDRFMLFKSYVENDIQERIKQLSAKMGNNAEDMADNYEIGTFQSLGAELNAELDKAFGSPVSAAAFQGVNPLSPVDNGHLLFDNFLNALTPIIEKSIKQFDGARAKYTGQFKGRRSK